MAGKNNEIVRTPDRGERFEPTDDGLPAVKPKPLRPEQLVRTEELQRALQGVGRIDAKQFFEDIDAIADPTPREWSDSDW